MTTVTIPPLKSKARITVIFLLYNASKTVKQLTECILSQKHPDHDTQSEWLDVIFMDDCSKDSTLTLLHESLSATSLNPLAQVGELPAGYRIEPNPTNLGLSRTLNRAFDSVTTPYVLTCHCDCFFGDPFYVSQMLTLLEKYPKIGALTGQQTIPQGKELPFAEKLNLITNLMDIFPPQTREEILPVGFAEGRCDAFRMETLKAVGFYDTNLRLAGEDQVIAAKMRENGYQVCQAPQLKYFLSVSDEQDSLQKLMRHQQLFGRAHPYILLRSRGTGAGVVGAQAGANRQSRTFLRVVQLMASFIYFFSFAGIILGASAWVWITPLFLVFILKTLLFLRHFQAVPLDFRQALAFYAAQPLLDISYSYGLCQGVWLLFRSSWRNSSNKPIS